MGRFILRSSLILALILGVSFSASLVVAQKPTVARNHPFEPAEELIFEAEFSRAVLRNLDVAEFKFRASRVPLATAVENPTANEKSSYTLNFNADVASKGFFTRLFNLNFRERVESTVEPESFTIQRTTIHDEQGKRVRLTETTFDRDKGKMSWTLRDPNNPNSQPRNSVTDFSGQLQDVLSAIYYIRTQPLQLGKTFDIFIGDGGRVYQVPVAVVAAKRMKTIFGQTNVIRVDPQLFGPNRMIEKEKGELSIWLTADSKHIPVSCKIKTDYGTFDVKLKSATYNPPK
jgi:uncharacterized protein DUF3108